VIKYQIRSLGRLDYLPVWQSMRDFTAQRTEATPDEVWVVEHNPVYTLGQTSKRLHIINTDTIPVIQTDRGGQVTYHGPGQLVIYFLLDLRRLMWTVRTLVSTIENKVIRFLAGYKIPAHARPEAPGVYVQDAKIASIGLRIRHGCCYHGLALNVAMDLKPFLGIHPCGFSNLSITQLSDLGGPQDLAQVTSQLLDYF
jgi:lipoyl(octanoyl) transferase